jgi:hypothetical protein
LKPKLICRGSDASTVGTLRTRIIAANASERHAPAGECAKGRRQNAESHGSRHFRRTFTRFVTSVAPCEHRTRKAAGNRGHRFRRLADRCLTLSHPRLWALMFPKRHLIPRHE